MARTNAQKHNWWIERNQVSDGTNDYYDYSGATLTLGKWHHVCAVWNPSTTYAKFYLDGVDVGRQFSTTQSGMGNSNNDVELRIGRASSGYTNSYFNGKMANVAMWTRELSPEEVQSVMNKSYSQLGSVEKTSLVSWWALDSASNGVVQPATGETITLISNRDFSGIADGTNPTTLSYIFAYGSPGELTINNEQLKIVDSGNTGCYWKETGLTSSKLYKVNIEATGDVASGGVYSTDVSLTLSNGTFTGYVTGKTQIIVYLRANDNSAGTTFYDNLKIEEVTSNTGVVTGATTTTSVYGGNAPILPRAIDIAESFADKIGNGSALFNGTSDYVQTANNINITGAMPRSFTLWANPTATIQYYELIEWGGTGTTNATCGLYFYNSKIFFYGWSTGDFDTGVAPLSEWQHLAVTYDGTTVKVYQNGILIGSSSESLNTANTAVKIGVSQTNEFSGNMSQVGIWTGALTQAQIQSVMESTSYAKIPASIKSNLGSEKVANATDWTDSNSDGLADNWSEQYSGKLDFSIVTGNGFTANAQRFEVNDVAGNDRAIRTSATVFTSGTLYKVSFKYRASISSGSILVMDGGSGTNVTNITTHTGDAKLFETYYVAPTGSHLWFYMQNADANAFMEIDEVSIKEVTNDLVAYYPLDADSSANGVTNDVTTGETLSDELFTNSASSSNWTWDSSANTLTGASVTNDAYSNVLSGVAEGDIVKVTFDITGFTGGGFYLNLAGGAYPSFSVANESYTIYVISGSGTKKLAFDGSAPFTGVISNISAKKVTSNTGVLK